MNARNNYVLYSLCWIQVKEEELIDIADILNRRENLESICHTVFTS